MKYTELVSAINNVETVLVATIKAQADKGAPNEFPSSRSVAILASGISKALVEIVGDEVIDVEHEGKTIHMKRSEVFALVLGKGLPNWIAQTSTVQKKAVSEGIYVDKSGKATKAASAADELVKQLFG